MTTDPKFLGQAYRENKDGLRCFHPFYLTEGIRATLSKHTDRPIMEELNTLYGYWTTIKNLTRQETAHYLGEPYVSNYEAAVREDRRIARAKDDGSYYDFYRYSEGY